MRSLVTIALVILLLAVGCERASIPTTDSATSVAIPTSTETIISDEEDHEHRAGHDGGTLVSLGRDSYHVEVVFDAEGKIWLYTLGKDESRIIDIEKRSLKGFVKAAGESKAQSIVFEPFPQDGDGIDRTSAFVATLPQDLNGKNVDVTIPNIAIEGERFRLAFSSTGINHDEPVAMPEKVVDQAERSLYLTASGRYTASDIEANGTLTAAEKFKGIKSSHDMFPKSGDSICPITQTKANPKFSWIVDGKPYLFCCPPCIDEFVKNAKATNDPLEAPEFYVKK